MDFVFVVVNKKASLRDLLMAPIFKDKNVASVAVFIGLAKSLLNAEHTCDIDCQITAQFGILLTSCESACNSLFGRNLLENFSGHKYTSISILLY